MTQRSGGVPGGSINCRVRAAAEPIIVPPFGGGVDIEAVDADRRRPEEPFPLSWVVSRPTTEVRRSPACRKPVIGCSPMQPPSMDRADHRDRAEVGLIRAVRHDHRSVRHDQRVGACRSGHAVPQGAPFQHSPPTDRPVFPLVAAFRWPLHNLRVTNRSRGWVAVRRGVPELVGCAGCPRPSSRTARPGDVWAPRCGDGRIGARDHRHRGDQTWLRAP